jgi:hypothetical protein
LFPAGRPGSVGHGRIGHKKWEKDKKILRASAAIFHAKFMAGSSGFHVRVA